LTMECTRKSCWLVAFRRKHIGTWNIYVGSQFTHLHWCFEHSLRTFLQLVCRSVRRFVGLSIVVFA
jgi:hypothetical protein